MEKIRNDKLVPSAVEWWEKELEDYLNTDEHLFDCAGYSEGLKCCLNRPWIRKFIKKIIKKDVGLLQKVLEDLELGMVMWRDDPVMHGKRLARYKKFEAYIEELRRV